MGCEEVQRLLDERFVACRGELERLRAEAERVAELIGVRETDLVRLDTARQVVGELPVAHAAVANVSVPGPRRNPGAEAAARARGQRASDYTGQVHRAVESLFVSGASAVRCQDVVLALGQEVAHREVERARHHLKRLVDAGKVVQLKPGLFALAGAPAAAGG